MDDCCVCVVFLQAEDGIRDLVRSRGLGDVYKRQAATNPTLLSFYVYQPHAMTLDLTFEEGPSGNPVDLSLIHI